MYRFIFTICFLAVMVGSAQSAEFDRSQYYSYGTKFYAETHAFPSEYSDSLDVGVFFKLMNEVVVFNKEQGSKDRYFAVPTLEISCKDSDGIIRKRHLWKDTVRIKGYDKTLSKTDFIHGASFFRLKAGEYKVNIKVDANFIKQAISKDIEFDVSHSFYDKPTFSKPLFAMANSDRVKPIVASNNASFEQNGATVYIPVSFNSDSKPYYFRCESLDKNLTRTNWMADVSFTGQVKVLKNKGLDYPVNRDFLMKDFGFKPLDKPADAGTNIQAGLLQLELPGNELYPGYYKLSIHQEGSQDTLYHEFQVVWEKEPLSLKDVDYAVEAVKKILSEDDYDMINSGTDKEKWIKLLQYWKNNDPTPQTPYNEAMATYYERVDYAFFNYSTVAEKDGSFTDRGLIYILNGPADSIEDSLNENNKVEIWKYNRLGKIFTFESLSVGELKLLSITDLEGKKLTE